jgi:hypothetical protein
VLRRAHVWSSVTPYNLNCEQVVSQNDRYAESSKHANTEATIRPIKAAPYVASRLITVKERSDSEVLKRCGKSRRFRVVGFLLNSIATAENGSRVNI